MTHDHYAELDDEIPLLSLIGGLAMALVIVVFKPGRRRRQNDVDGILRRIDRDSTSTFA